MADKKVKTRIQSKHDTAVNWSAATGFIPLKGEIIIYDPDTEYDYARVKVGDGETAVPNLPFIDKGVNESLNTLISSGTDDPTADTNSQYYFKYN